jgi:lipid II:glycine glycyltransferase (peptidoglycan interpeptide bridge formation enzyme)
MRLIDQSEKDTWNAFVLDNAPQSGAFLQMFEWGEFQRAVGHEPRRLLCEFGGEVVGGAQFLIRPLAMGRTYAYCPRGPLLQPNREQKMFRQLQKIKALQGQVFLRFEPTFAMKGDRARRVDDVQPSHTLITDLSPEEDDIMMDMHSKTRYNVRLAGRKGVEVEVDPDLNFDEVWPLFVETAKRGEFTQHDKKHFVHLLDALDSPDCRAFLAVARFEGEVLAVNIMIDCNGVRTYLHGASSSKNRNVMAPYKLHWELMRDAKQNGILAYDWWGVKPEGAGEDHPLHGVTRFKEKFGGERVAYPGTFDYPLQSFWYSAYRIARRFKR